MRISPFYKKTKPWDLNFGNRKFKSVITFQTSHTFHSCWCHRWIICMLTAIYLSRHLLRRSLLSLMLRFLPKRVIVLVIILSICSFDARRKTYMWIQVYTACLYICCCKSVKIWLNYPISKWRLLKKWFFNKSWGAHAFTYVRASSLKSREMVN